MRIGWLVATAAIIAIVSPALADGLGANPAFCFGYLEARAPALSAALEPEKPAIEALFARRGPKDSTDERGFEDWRRIGRVSAADTATSTDPARLTTDCARLLDLK